jgi:NADPH:quinone reductase-like Zn-dependent oxidoreductase
MKAAYIQQFGGPEVLKYGDLPDPVAGAGQVVVDTVAASVNGADPKVAAGEYKQTSFPLILGRDFSGVVSAVGSGALIGLTALRSVEDTLKLKSGETVLIQGGAGGVAGFAIQLAKHIGAHVITTTSMGNLGFVRDLGADEVIDYKTTDFTKVVKNCDAVFDTVGGDVALKSFAVLKPGGRAAFIASGAQAPKPERSDVTALRPAVGRDRPPLERIAELYASGAVRKPHVTLYDLSKAQEALRISEARHLKGKLVLKVK